VKLLDWYILRRFLATLGYAVFAFVFIVIFVDMVGNLGKFIDKDVPQGVILKYYLFTVPYMTVLALPIAMLLASLLSLGQMNKYYELTAIKSVGISLYRTLLPIFVCGLFVSLAALAIGEIVVPPTNQEKTRITNEYLESRFARAPKTVTDVFWRDRKDRTLFMGRYEPLEQTGHKVSIQTFVDNEIIERIDAPTMKWEDGVWKLRKGFKRSFNGDEETAEPFETLNDEDLDLRPETIPDFKVKPDDMSYAELKMFATEVMKNGGDPNRWLVDLNFKLSIPLANFIMVLFGAPIASSRKQSNAVFGFIISLMSAFIYYALTP
jgi:lipopolysaccharide export system permease protein